MKHFNFLFLFYFFLLQSFNFSLAQSTYPEKQIRLVVGFSAGGPTDIPARYIAERLSTILGKKVVVDNKVGAGGQIATLDVLSKPRDGYNLLLCTHFEGINAAISKNANYKLSDIAPISQISRYYYAVVITSEIPPNNWEGFVKYAKSLPTQLNYGLIGRGSAQEMLALELTKFSGIDMVGVPYKGGTEMMSDLVSGRIQLYVSPTGPIISMAQNGKVKILAVSSPERLAVLPDTPTLSEKSVPFVRFGWLGICSGSGTAASIINTLNRAIVDIVQTTEYKEMIEKTGSIAGASKPEELSRTLNETYDQTLKVITDFKLQMN